MRTAGCTASAVLGLVMLLPFATAEAAQLVVVEARGIALRPGEMLDGEKPLSLQQGQHVTLISQSGATLKLDGPYDRAPGAESNAGTNLASVLQPLIARQEPRTSEVGVVRGAPAAMRLPDPWLINVSRTGNVCLREGDLPLLWRPSDARQATLSLLPGDRSWKAQATWPGGTDRLLVPATVPLHAGATYLAALDGAEVAITLNAVPLVLANDAMRAAWMVQKGCEAQAEALLHRQ
ncbi:MAG TPA: hypothetical protein VN832_12875 [Stellaceae bacterium]|nr:hypothetical protein [Stellaceae bacterium]